MILPAKHLSQERCLSGVGAEIIRQLDRPLSASELWVRVCRANENFAPTFDWFALALSFLYAINAIDYDGQLILPTGDNHDTASV